MNKERLWNTKRYHSRASPLKKKTGAPEPQNLPLALLLWPYSARFHYSRAPFFKQKTRTLEPPNLPLTLLLRPIILDSQSAPHKRPPRQPRSRPVSAYHERPPRQSRSRAVFACHMLPGCFQISRANPKRLQLLKSLLKRGFVLETHWHHLSGSGVRQKGH